VPVRVLLVDDVPEMRQLVRTAMRLRGGFEVVGEAADGETAIELATRSKPDIVVLDLGLPRLVGREVLTRLRERLPLVKVVVFTGTNLDDSENLRDQVEGYVLKDSDVTYLLDLLAHLGETAQRAAVLELPLDLTSPRRARQFLLSNCARWGCGPVVDTAELVVSELVTNAISHGRSRCELRLGLSGSALRVEVTDHGGGTPDPLVASDVDEHGRGLLLVSAVATAWGVEAVPGDGKLVWAQIALPPAQPIVN
jgi:CheY-like chemotaxis protein/anti-sigma regulatory factor (Ser/Thr protein kinase)